MKAKTLISRIVVTPFVLAFVFAASIALGLSSADSLMSYGMSPEAANFIATKMIVLNSSGNIVLPVASAKKASITVAGTEELLVDGTNITAATNNVVVSAGNITATAGNLVAGGTLAVTGTSTLATVSSTGLKFPTANEEAVAGAGTVVGDAAAFSATKHVHQLTGANGTVGWKFTTSTAGQFEFLLNTTAGVPKVYAASGGTCNGGAADAACTLVTGIVAHLCYSTAADTWICA